MSDRTLLRTGVVGAVVAAVCCFTPILAVAFGLVGLTAWLGYVDYVLLPTFAFFVGLTVYALHRRRQTARGRDVDSGD